MQSRSHQECSSDAYKMVPFKTKAAVYVFTNLNLCVNFVPSIVKIHIMQTETRDAKKKPGKSTRIWIFLKRRIFFFYLNRPSVHTKPMNSLTETASFSNRCPEQCPRHNTLTSHSLNIFKRTWQQANPTKFQLVDGWVGRSAQLLGKDLRISGARILLCLHLLTPLETFIPQLGKLGYFSCPSISTEFQHSRFVFERCEQFKEPSTQIRV